MRTSKPFSTISYNTDVFLTSVLSDLVNDHIIDFWCYMEHQPEEDEKKAHKHLYMVPCGLVDTFFITNKLREPDPTHPQNPLGVIRFVSSRFADWYMYALHDPDYLATKGECRAHHYQRDDMIYSDNDYYLELIHTSDFSKYKMFRKFREMVQSGVSFADLLKNGFIPIQQVRQYEFAYNTLLGRSTSNSLYRGNHSNHEANQFTKPPSQEEWDKLNETIRLQNLKRSVQTSLALDNDGKLPFKRKRS